MFADDIALYKEITSPSVICPRTVTSQLKLRMWVHGRVNGCSLFKSIYISYKHSLPLTQHQLGGPPLSTKSTI